MHLEDGFHQSLFVLIDVERGHTRQLRKIFASGKYNRPRTTFEEESRMLEVDLCRHEVVDIHVGRIIHQFTEGMEHTDGRHWNDFFQKRLKTHARESVRVDDGYFGQVFHNPK